jgi:hypothetical protein
MPSITTDGLLNGALAGFTAAIDGYLPLLIIWGTRLLAAVAFIGFGWATIQAVSNRDWYGTIIGMGWGVARIAMVYVFMTNLQSWGPAFPSGFQQIAADITGQSPSVLTPSGVYELGLNIVKVMRDNFHFASWFIHPIDDAEIHVLTVLTQICWFAIACTYFGVLIETKWIVAKGAVTIVFASVEHGFDCLSTWVVSLVQIGVRLLGVMVVLAIGLILATGWTDAIEAMGTSFNLNPTQNGLISLGEGLLLWWAIWSLPKKAARLIHARGVAGVGAESSGIDAGAFAAGTYAYRKGAEAVATAAKAAARAVERAVTS